MGEVNEEAELSFSTCNLEGSREKPLMCWRLETHGTFLVPPEEDDSRLEEQKDKDGTHLVPWCACLLPRVGAWCREQAVSREDGCRPQHEGSEEVHVDIITGAAQPPGGFGRLSRDL